MKNMAKKPKMHRDIGENRCMQFVAFLKRFIDFLLFYTLFAIHYRFYRNQPPDP